MRRHFRIAGPKGHAMPFASPACHGLAPAFRLWLLRSQARRRRPGRFKCSPPWPRSASVLPTEAHRQRKCCNGIVNTARHRMAFGVVKRKHCDQPRLFEALCWSTIPANRPLAHRHEATYHTLCVAPQTSPPSRHHLGRIAAHCFDCVGRLISRGHFPYWDGPARCSR